MQTRFVAAYASLRALPAPGRLELAVAGRSNCGKSSLINAITGRRRLARTSSTPGRTRELVFFSLKQAGLDPFYLVDLPGYGYARVSRTLRQAWGQVVSGYVDRRESLGALLLLMDIRRQPADEERDLLSWVLERGVQPLVVLTKGDKLPKSRRLPAAAAVKRALQLQRRPPVVSINDPASVAALQELLIGLVRQLQQDDGED
jgi:GTP-binding protein